MTEEHSGGELCAQLENIALEDELSEDILAEKIASNLNESNKELIHRIVETIGVNKSLIVYNETVHIQKSGGIKRDDGKGFKTPGGVFFYVIYHNEDIFDDSLRKVFAEDAHKKEKLRRIHDKEERRKRTEQWKTLFKP